MVCVWNIVLHSCSICQSVDKKSIWGNQLPEFMNNGWWYGRIVYITSVCVDRNTYGGQVDVKWRKILVCVGNIGVLVCWKNEIKGTVEPKVRSVFNNGWEHCRFHAATDWLTSWQLYGEIHLSLYLASYYFSIYQPDGNLVGS